MKTESKSNERLAPVPGTTGVWIALALSAVFLLLVVGRAQLILGQNREKLAIMLDPLRRRLFAADLAAVLHESTNITHQNL